MALRDRVLILPDGTCQVSMQGFDVKTAELDQMAFDTRFSSIGQAVWGNAILAKRDTLDDPGQNTSIAFGRTFSSPPMFLFGWTLSNDISRMLPPRISGFNDQYFRRKAQVDAKVLNASVTFRNWYCAVETSASIKVYWKALI